MKKITLILLFPLFLALASCCLSKKGFEVSKNPNDAIHIAIADFSNNSKLYKKDSIFSVELLGLTNHNDLIVVRIGKNNRKMLLTSEVSVGSKGKLASEYLEKDGKLFFWWDDDRPLTKEAIDVFDRYDLLQDDQGGTLKVPEFIIDDSQLGAHYYFCKFDFSKFKRVITNKGLGYYDPPHLRCRNNRK